MCGRYTLTRDDLRFADRLRLGDRPQLEPRYNIAPTQEAPVVLREESGLRMELLRWGLIPHWAKEASIGSRMINARAESVADKPGFRHAFRRHRCLVPADGFYEWMKIDGAKQPVRIVRKDRGVFAFAGLWDRWRSPEGREVRSFTIITTEANSLLKTVHDRMPVILPEEVWEPWLDASVKSEQLSEWLRPIAAEALEFYEVGTAVNNSRNEGPQCAEPRRLMGSEMPEEMRTLGIEI